MKIAILDHIDALDVDRALSDNIIYRPDVLKKGVRSFLRLLTDNGISAVVTSQPIPGNYLQQWNDASKKIKHVVYFGKLGTPRDPVAIAGLPTIRFRKADGITVHRHAALGKVPGDAGQTPLDRRDRKGRDPAPRLA